MATEQPDDAPPLGVTAADDTLRCDIELTREELADTAAELAHRLNSRKRAGQAAIHAAQTRAAQAQTVARRVATRLAAPQTRATVAAIAAALLTIRVFARVRHNRRRTTGETVVAQLPRKRRPTARR